MNAISWKGIEVTQGSEDKAIILAIIYAPSDFLKKSKLKQKKKRSV